MGAIRPYNGISQYTHVYEHCVYVICKTVSLERSQVGAEVVG